MHDRIPKQQFKKLKKEEDELGWINQRKIHYP